MATCTFDGKQYSDGSLICSNGRELKCSSGQWIETHYSCKAQTMRDSAGVITVDQKLLDIALDRQQRDELGKLLAEALYGLRSSKPPIFAFEESDTKIGWEISASDDGIRGSLNADIGGIDVEVRGSVDREGHTDIGIGLKGSF